MKKIIILMVLYYLRFLAKIALFIARPKVIGITGSVGKSSTRNIIYALLKDNFPTKMIEKGNSETGIPLGILGVTPSGFSFLDWLNMLVKAKFGIFNLIGTKYLIIEMGIDEPFPPKNMEYLLTVVKPDISVFLNVSSVHTMQFEKALTAEEKKLDDSLRTSIIQKKIAQEKFQIITQSNCKVAVFNNDDPLIKELVGHLNKDNLKLYAFGKDTASDIFYKEYSVNLGGSNFTFNIKQDGEISINIHDYILPEVYRESLAAAILVGFSVGLNTQQIKKSITQFSLPKGRVSILKGINNSTIIDSSYNASRSSVLPLLDMLEILKKKTNRKAVFIFGDMRELGEEAQKEHELVAERINEVIDYLYCVGPLTKQYVLPNVNKVKENQWFENSVSAGEYLSKRIPEDSIVLVKGSQNTIFLEETIKPILTDKSDISKLCRQEEFWMKKKILH